MRICCIGYITGCWFTKSSTAIAKLEKRIQAAITTIYEVALEMMVNNTNFRFRFTLHQNAVHFNNLLICIKFVGFIFEIAL